MIKGEDGEFLLKEEHVTLQHNNAAKVMSGINSLRNGNLESFLKKTEANWKRQNWDW